MILRSVIFDESAFAFSSTLPQNSVIDTAVNFDSINIGDEPFTMKFKQTGVRKELLTVKNIYNGDFLLVMEPD